MSGGRQIVALRCCSPFVDGEGDARVRPIAVRALHCVVAVSVPEADPPPVEVLALVHRHSRYQYVRAEEGKRSTGDVVATRRSRGDVEEGLRGAEASKVRSRGECGRAFTATGSGVRLRRGKGAG